MHRLAVLETHPVQYHAPVYRRVQERFGVPVTAVYGSDFSLAGYHDRDFGVTFAWDSDLVSGYDTVFLSRVAAGGASAAELVSGRGLDRALRVVAPRAVLLLGYGSRFDRAALYQAWRLGQPILFRGETSDQARNRHPLKARLRAVALRLLYGRCARLLYIGRRSYAHFRRLGCPERKLLFSPYCVDTAPFQTNEAARDRLRPAVRTELGLRDEQVALLLSGKLSPGKAPDLPLRAVRKLPPDLRERVVVLFLGDGELRPDLERLAGQAPAIPTRFMGFQNQTCLSQYYHAADLLVLPSLSETWGLVVNEALHHGLPCLVSEAVGSAPDLIDPGRTGIVFATGSAESLAAAIQTVLPIVGRPEVRGLCRERVEGYTVDRAAEGIARAYAAVVGEPHDR